MNRYYIKFKQGEYSKAASIAKTLGYTLLQSNNSNIGILHLNCSGKYLYSAGSVEDLIKIGAKEIIITDNFEIGDEVICLSNNNIHIKLGEVYTIKEIVSVGRGNIYRKEIDSSGGLTTGDLALISKGKKEMKYKAGDVVKIIECKGGHQLNIGQEYIIDNVESSINDNNKKEYSYIINIYWLSEDELELVDESKYIHIDIKDYNEFKKAIAFLSGNGWSFPTTEKIYTQDLYAELGIDTVIKLNHSTMRMMNSRYTKGKNYISLDTLINNNKQMEKTACCQEAINLDSGSNVKKEYTRQAQEAFFEDKKNIKSIIDFEEYLKGMIDGLSIAADDINKKHTIIRKKLNKFMFASNSRDIEEVKEYIANGKLDKDFLDAFVNKKIIEIGAVNKKKEKYSPEDLFNK